MSKKDFEALADAMYRVRPVSGMVEASRQWHSCLVVLSNVLAESNPRYDSCRFEHRAINGHNLTKKCAASLTGCTGGA